MGYKYPPTPAIIKFKNQVILTPDAVITITPHHTELFIRVNQGQFTKLFLAVS